ncbi:pyridoxine 5'-phosphate synthase [Agaricicola taiwanensis]|uniref:Pyridoxine 5'-phosphate synthase n=1 Tax=Agaricicola taiwanensis TaxID=591372 RepID=A0A8J2YJF6_9RHOB|nr:pyridoxine 5'-phosphate synthase [Agaricicola taiwanensis]GGE46771.1 pyridoxine 5'-phosphate synthase [Agaricicola taiwanensis]
MTSSLRLGVNIDHVATVRNARGGRHPDPVRAAQAAVAAGADGITAHLREDRRHIRDDDIARLRSEISAPLNLEMAATSEMLRIALQTAPHAVCLVPEKREERTTEGGLDVVGQIEQLRPIIGELSAAHIRVSLFIEPSEAAIHAAVSLGAPVVELHTGTWCEAIGGISGARAADEFERLKTASRLGRELGLEIHAGHGLDYVTAEAISALPEIAELNIGHFLIGEAIFGGMDAAIKRMQAAMQLGRDLVREPA